MVCEQCMPRLNLNAFQLGFFLVDTLIFFKWMEETAGVMSLHCPLSCTFPWHDSRWQQHYRLEFNCYTSGTLSPWLFFLIFEIIYKLIPTIVTSGWIEDERVAEGNHKWSEQEWTLAGRCSDLGETLDSGRDAAEQCQLVLGSRLRGKTVIAFASSKMGQKAENHHHFPK